VWAVLRDVIGKNVSGRAERRTSVSPCPGGFIHVPNLAGVRTVRVYVLGEFNARLAVAAHVETESKV
jgi:hypothetical protein